MPGLDYRAARAAIPLAEVLTLIGWQPRGRCGDQQRGPCPLHGSRSPTSRVLAVHLGKHVYHCFGCGAGGNALDLCQRLGRPVPWRNTRQRQKRQSESSQETKTMPP